MPTKQQHIHTHTHTVAFVWHVYRAFSRIIFENDNVIHNTRQPLNAPSGKKYGKNMPFGGIV